jgi:hypothetical protein
MGDIHDDLRDSLAQVQELLDTAAPGVWRVDQDRRVYNAEAYVCDANIRHTEYDNEATANAIAAAVNFLRTHGPTLLAMMEDHSPDAGKMGEDAARYRWLREQNTILDNPSAWTITRCDFTDEEGPSRYWVGSDLDAAIDAARAGERGVSCES